MDDSILAPGVAGGVCRGECRRLSRRALIALAAMLSVTLVLPDKASAHILGYESDDDNNRVITYCNPNDYWATYVNNAADAINGWDKYSAQYGRAAVNVTLVTAYTYPECELRIRISPDLPDTTLAQLDPNRGQDDLIFDNPRMQNQTKKGRQYAASHEMGHADGMAHNPGACDITIMNVTDCLTQALIQRYPQSHDGADINRFWVDPDTRVYPNTADWQRDGRLGLPEPDPEVLPDPS
jgi:hypothetical protein